MIVLAWVISLIAIFLFGFYLRSSLNLLKALQESVKNKVEKKPVEVEKSIILDPDDPIQRAKWEHDELMRQINPGLNDEM